MDFKCRHTGCKRVFDSKVGRAVHERLVHGEVLSLRKSELKCPFCENETHFDSELGRLVHLERYHGVSSESLDWIEKKTFENLVHLYTDELYKIRSEQVIGGVLDQRETTRLLREGVLIIEKHGRMGRQTIYRLSKETLEILNHVRTRASAHDMSLNIVFPRIKTRNNPI
jgi:hypothetical protein